MKTPRWEIQKCVGILKIYMILGWANASPNTIFFFKDPKYFRIFPQSVNITNNLNKLTMIKVNIIVFKIILS